MLMQDSEQFSSWCFFGATQKTVSCTSHSFTEMMLSYFFRLSVFLEQVVAEPKTITEDHPIELKYITHITTRVKETKLWLKTPYQPLVNANICRHFLCMACQMIIVIVQRRYFAQYSFISKRLKQLTKATSLLSCKTQNGQKPIVAPIDNHITRVHQVTAFLRLSIQPLVSHSWSKAGEQNKTPFERENGNFHFKC